MRNRSLAALFLLGAMLLCLPAGCDNGGADNENGGKGPETSQDVSSPDSSACEPSCEGRVCGNDGCGGSCGHCYTVEGAPDDSLCTDKGQCLSCLPDCTGRVCGNDGCGGSCGHCFTLEGAVDDSLCTAEGACVQCVPDCAGKACGDDGCGATCGSCSGSTVCAGGQCVEDTGLCQTGEVCMAYSDDGSLACLKDGEIPADQETQCHLKDAGCSGNQACLYTDDTQANSVCVENCGECPNGLTCGDVTGDGYLGCMQAGSIPSNAKKDCHKEGNGCPGNATCFYTSADYSTSACIENCSACHEGSCPEGMVCNGVFCEPAPCTPDSCPAGEVCTAGLCIPDAGPGPGPFTANEAACNLPPLQCTGTKAYCGELIQFDPVEGTGYTDYPENGESWSNQYRSWLRRDLVMAIQYAAARVACLAKDWEFGNGGPVGLIDMSEKNGDIPGTSVGSPGHPSGTHTDGFDIDVAYFQNGTPDNRARPVCEHYENGAEAYHCTKPPHLLDPWREALFVGSLFEHPLLRVIGCDGKVGPILDASLEVLCDNGWVKPAACKNNVLTYESTDMGYGWYYFHHHHIHVSLDLGSYRDACLVPGCLDLPLRHFLFKHGLASMPGDAALRPPHLVPVSKVR